MLRPYQESVSLVSQWGSWRHLAPRESVAGGLFERTNTLGERRGSCVYGLRLFDFRNERRAYDCGIGKAAKNGNMARQ